MRPPLRSPSALVVLLVLVACGGAPAGAQPAAPADAPRPPETPAAVQAAPADTGVVRVSGTGEVSVTPDRARVTVAVESEAPTAAEAAGENADRMDAVLRALRAGGFEGLEIETFGYAVTPVYATETEGGRRVQRIQGYRAANNVGATVAEPDAAGRVVDAAVGAGANRIGGISFFASDTREARDEALRRAVEEATRQARIMAGALGRTLGAPIEVQGGAETPRPFARAAPQMEMMQARADTPVEVGDQTVTARVSITFALGPAGSR